VVERMECDGQGGPRAVQRPRLAADGPPCRPSPPAGTGPAPGPLPHPWAASSPPPATLGPLGGVALGGLALALGARTRPTRSWASPTRPGGAPTPPNFSRRTRRWQGRVEGWPVGASGRPVAAAAGPNAVARPSLAWGASEVFRQDVGEGGGGVAEAPVLTSTGRARDGRITTIVRLHDRPVGFWTVLVN